MLKEFRKRFLGKRPALLKSGQWHFHQDNALVNNSILVTYYLTKTCIKIVPQPPESPDLAPSDFWLFPKPRGCRYETIKEQITSKSFMCVLSIKVPIRKKSLETYRMHLVSKTDLGFSSLTLDTEPTIERGDRFIHFTSSLVLSEAQTVLPRI